ncbi:MAG TPA: hypothetical protein VKA97_13350, partial [Pyrinomonadaceae bacterium]|nr:hypothetical protein [Pyrinomonadaceae bacterium]
MRGRQQDVLAAARRRHVRVLVNPLVVGVVVDADRIQVFRAPAELRAASAGDHIPRLKLRLTVSFG